MAAKGFLLLPLFLISVIRYYRSKIQTKIYFPFCLIFCTFNRTFVSLKPKHKYIVSIKKKGSTPTYLVHISNISSKDLQNINNRAPMEQAYNKAVSPIHVRYLYGRCPVDVRYKSGQVPDI